jgi:phosphatidate cytidylyltransferase
VETAACATGLPAAWGILLLAAAAGCGPELAATIAPTPLPWILAGLALGVAWIALPAWTVGLTPIAAALLVFATPYGSGRTPLVAAQAASLAYFAGAPLGAFLAVTELPQLGFALAAAATTHVADIAAGFAGKLGGPRPFRLLSPGKTVVGFAAAALAGPLMGWLSFGCGLGVASGRALLLGLIVAGAGVAGDLVASKIKRLAGVKDFGAFLEPHGGIADRLDSLVMVMATLPWLLTLGRSA